MPGCPTSRVCEAAFALAEGKVTTTAYFPNRAGSTLQISYRNAVRKPVRHSFGSFRLNGSLELSCFAGAKGSLEAGIKTGKGAAEGPSGALALLGTSSIDVSKAGGRLGLKAEGFAGAEAGGALSGAVEWPLRDVLDWTHERLKMSLFSFAFDEDLAPQERLTSRGRKAKRLFQDDSIGA